MELHIEEIPGNKMHIYMRINFDQIYIIVQEINRVLIKEEILKKKKKI